MQKHPSEYTGSPERLDQAAELRTLCRREETHRPWTATRCVAIGSGKGGVGKTMVSVGLAMTLSERGHRVLLFDGDMGLANVDIQMGLVPEFTLQDVIFGRCSMAQARLSVENGPDVLVSASGAPDLADLSEARRRLFITDLFRFASQYDYFLIDTGAGIGHGTTDFLAASPEVLLVLTNEPTSLMDVYALIKTLHLRGSGQGMGIIVNMVDSLDEGERVFTKLQAIVKQFIGSDLEREGIILHDRRVSEAIRHQQSIVRYAAQGGVAHCLRDLAKRLESRPRRKNCALDMERFARQWSFTEFLQPKREEA